MGHQPGRVPPSQYPWWVRFSLIASRTRNSQWVWLFGSLAAGTFFVALASGETGVPRIVLAVAGIWSLIYAGMYLATIRWMDRHGSWS